MNDSWLLWGLLFGSIGLGYFIYGRRQNAIVPLVTGLVLMAFPYFVSTTLWLLVVGAALLAVPWMVRI
jgi:heme/copper-type cytochrome/quinol oxidase subunit 1